MFKKLTDFSYQRNKKEAFGLYIAYVFLAILLGFLVGAIYALVSGDESFEAGVRAGNIMAIFYCLGLAITVAHFKGGFTSFKNIVLIILGGLLAVFVGALGGLIPVAYLSTLGDPRNLCEQQD